MATGANTTHSSHTLHALTSKANLTSPRGGGTGKSPLLSVWHTEVIKDDLCEHHTPQPQATRSHRGGTGKVQANRLPLP